MMQSYASAAKLQGGGPILNRGTEAMKEFLALSLDNAARRKILWDNCARLYDIPKLAAPLTRAAPAAAAAA